MLTSLALIFLMGLVLAALMRAVKLPRIIGMLITGVVLGPYVLNLLDPSILLISGDLRQMALIIILIKAGLSLDPADLKRVGRPALLLSFLPALCEFLACMVLAPIFLPLNYIEGALLGAVLAAVSPAVVVPRMVNLMEEKRGTNHQIPQLLLAGSSLDDVFVIVLFSAFLGMAGGEKPNFAAFLNIPISIVLGILVGVVVGFLLSHFFEFFYKRHRLIRNSTKVIIVLSISFLLIALEHLLEGIVAVSGLLAVVAMATVLAVYCVPPVTERLKEKFGKLWIAAEVILFVLVGAAVDLRYTLTAGAGALAVIFLALIARSLGVLLSLAFTKLTAKERLFCVIAYLPKATVQAAIGGVPLTMGLPCGMTVLSVAVLSILLTAPLGAIGMDATASRLLVKEETEEKEPASTENP